MTNHNQVITLDDDSDHEFFSPLSYVIEVDGDRDSENRYQANPKLVNENKLPPKEYGSVNQLLEVLSEFPELGDPHISSTTAPSKVDFRLKFLDREGMMKWISRFGEETETNWIMSTSIPAKGQYRYSCCFSKTNKTKNPDHFSSRNKNCKSYVSFQLTTVNASSRVRVNWIHTHTVLEDINFRNLGLLRCLPETVARLEQYFREGDNVAGAQMRNRAYVKQVFDDPFTESNAQHVPTDRTVRYLYEKYVAEHLGGSDAESISQKLDELTPVWQASGGFVLVNRQPFTILLANAVMVRSWDRPAVYEGLYVDSTSNVDATGATLTIAISGSPIGGLPLAYIITYSEDEAAFVSAFSLLDSAVFKGRHPRAIMRDDAHVLAISLYKEIRQHIMALVRSYLYAVTEPEAETALTTVLQDEYCTEELKKRVLKYWSCRDLYLLCVRANELRGNNCNNLTEAAVKIVKEQILARRKFHNPVALASCIMSEGHEYYRTRLMKFATGRNVRRFLDEEKLQKAATYLQTATVQRTEENVYLVPSSCGTQVYTVDTILGTCTCRQGLLSKKCKHIYGLMCFYDKEIPFWSSSTTPECRQSMYFIATGETMPINFFNFDNINASSSAPVPLVDPAGTNNNCSDAAHQNPTIIGDEQDPTSMEILKTTAALFETVLMKSGKSTDSLRQLSRVLKTQNPNKIISAIFDCGVKRMRRPASSIHVQPTAVSRRTHSGYKGRAPLGAGRPKSGANRSKKRPHSLASAIAKGHANAK